MLEILFVQYTDVKSFMLSKLRIILLCFNNNVSMYQFSFSVHCLLDEVTVLVEFCKYVTVNLQGDFEDYYFCIFRLRSIINKLDAYFEKWQFQF